MPTLFARWENVLSNRTGLCCWRKYRNVRDLYWQHCLWRSIDAADFETSFSLVAHFLHKVDRGLHNRVVCRNVVIAWSPPSRPDFDPGKNFQGSRDDFPSLCATAVFASFNWAAFVHMRRDLAEVNQSNRHDLSTYQTTRRRHHMVYAGLLTDVVPASVYFPWALSQKYPIVRITFRVVGPIQAKTMLLRHIDSSWMLQSNGNLKQRATLSTIGKQITIFDRWLNQLHSKNGSVKM